MDEQQLSVQINEIESAVDAVLILSEEDRGQVLSLIRESKSTQGNVKNFFADMKNHAHKAWKNIVAKENEFLNPLKEAEEILRTELKRWDDEQTRIREAEEKRLRERAAKEAEKEREKLLRLADKAEDHELKEKAIEAAEMVTETEIYVPEVKHEGATYRDNWKGNVTDLNALLKAVLDGNDNAKMFIAVNDKALNSFAKATKGAVTIPGIEFSNKKTLVVK